MSIVEYRLECADLTGVFTPNSPNLNDYLVFVCLIQCNMV